jgi:hypothetical protein
MPYRCRGQARFNLRTQKWRVDRCENQLERVEPLLAEPGPLPALGLNEDWGVLQPYLDEARSIGADPRFSISWEDVELTPDKYRWDFPDRLFQFIRHIRLHPIVNLVNAPCWAQELPAPCPVTGAPTAANVNQYAEFAALVADRYPEIAAIEVWNEPNWTPYWKPLPDPALYGEMVRAVADAVHAVNPSLPVLVAGNAPLGQTTADGANWAYDEFLQAVYETGGIGGADAVGHHVYFGQTANYTYEMRRQITRVRAVMSSNGDGDLPIWITEIGVSSEPSLGEEGQALALGVLWHTAARIPNLPVFVVHRFLDTSDPDIGIEDYRGLYGLDGNPKIAFCVLGAMRGFYPELCPTP